jgi:ribonuclease-3
VTPERESRLQALGERLGHRFSDLALLDRALTHASRANESPAGVPDNEPLEFLGDSVLGFVIADLLHRRDPDGDEGTKSKARAHLVSSSSLARRSLALGLPDLLLLGRGEEKTGGRQKAALWVNAYEAVLAALYLDAGIDAAFRFVRDEFEPDLLGTSDLAPRDHKSALQEHLQARGDPVPDYRVASEEGPSHRRRFRIQCVVRGEVVSEGEGYSKKQAQQEAARQAPRRCRRRRRRNRPGRRSDRPGGHPG